MSSILIYATSSFKILGPRRPLWKEWVENLHKCTSVPDAQLDKLGTLGKSGRRIFKSVKALQ